MKKLFVAIVTGQKVSNFPPILQRAEKGDKVLWIVSEEAKENEWLKYIPELLGDRGIGSDELYVEDLYRIEDLRQKVFGKVVDESTERIFFILNGGPKLTPIGLALAGEDLRKEKKDVCYLHGDIKTFYRSYSKLLQGAGPEIFEYDREKMLSLSEIVKINGKKLKGPTKVWSKDSFLLSETSDAFLEKYIRTLEEGKVDEKGAVFEKLVFYRTIEFFRQNGEYEKIIKEVALNSEILRADKQKFAELDVAIVLLNGVVLHLECKTGVMGGKKSKRKDFQARVFALRETTSRIAKLYLIYPYFPELLSSELAAKQKQNKEYIEEVLTLSDIKRMPLTQHPDKEIAFEEELKEVLNRFAN